MKFEDFPADIQKQLEASADMFWNVGDSEGCCCDSIYEVAHEAASYGDFDEGRTMLVRVQQAVRLPDIVVKIFEDEKGDIDYEVVADEQN